MKKTLVAILIGSAILLTGCQDKESQAKIEQLNQTVAQLTEQNKQLEMDLLAQKVRADNMIPAIFSEEDVVFKKSETIKYPKSKDEFAPEEGKIEYAISTLKTNVDWLNTLLWEEFARDEGKVPTREEMVAAFEKDFANARKDMTETPSIGYESSRWIDFIGQKEKLATFAIGYYDFSGGAHGVGGNRYFTLDMTTHKVLKLNDLFDDKALAKVKDLLWQRYTNGDDVKDDEVFTTRKDFTVSNNFYMDSNGVHFIYNVYEIAPYAAGEQDLILGWRQLEELLTPSFKQQGYVKFAPKGE